MRVTIQVESGLKAGHRFVLRQGEQLKFGRTEWAEAVFPGDRHMSAVHFKIQNDQDVCYLEDEKSKHGTIVNDQPVTRVVLRPGDRIRAGETTFSVEMEGVTSDAAAVAAGAQPPDVQSSIGGGPATYSFERCKSTVNRYRGSVVEMPPARLAKLLHKNYRTTLILDPAKLPPPPSPQLSSDEYLLDWLPENVRRANSPILLCEEQQLGDLSVVHRAWGKDTLVAVYSEKEEALPLPQLRRCAGVFARPSILRPLLSETAAEPAHDFLLEIEAVLVEDESPDAWVLYSTCDLEPMLQQFDLRKAPQDTPPDPRPAGRSPA
jgi:hypothetical protein